MVRPAATDDFVQIRRTYLRLPVELRVPDGFDAATPSTWPEVDGRLELVDGRLLFTPPCGDVQQDVCIATGSALYAWARTHPEFVVGGNEAGMILADDVRAADIAVWRRTDAEPRTGGFRHKPPILAVEVVGQDDDEAALRDKARWYLGHGVEVVWIVLPQPREVVAITPAGESRHDRRARLAHPSLPDLDVAVSELFAQL